MLDKKIELAEKSLPKRARRTSVASICCTYFALDIQTWNLDRKASKARGLDSYDRRASSAAE